MSKIDDILDKYNNEDIKTVCFKDACTYTRGITYKKNDEIKTDSHRGIKVLRANNINLSNTLKLTNIKMVSEDVKVRLNQQLRENDILICAGSGSKKHIGKTAFITKNSDNFTFGGFMGVIRVSVDFISPKYVFYLLNSAYFRNHLDFSLDTSTINNLNNSVMNSFCFPVPPIELQEEIVRILDNFTELEAKLKAELEARKKQYNYYRHELLKADKSVRWINLGSVCDVLTGGEPPKNTIKGSKSDDEHPYPVWGNGKEVYGFSSSYRVDIDAVVISSIGAKTGTVYFRTAHFTPIIRLKVVIPKTKELNMRYLFHALSDLNIVSKSSTVPNMNSSDIKKIVIPYPEISKQEEIADLLDKFDSYISSINSGLPAEIESRRKQYEYYRTSLLTF